jgi:regulatory protein
MTQPPFEDPETYSTKQQSRAARRSPPRLSRAGLERSALAYLERYSSSSANLRRVLLRKARRSCEHHGGELAEAEALIDAVVAALARQGLVDDRAFAAGLSRRLRRRGSSARRIRASLLDRGIPGELADEVLGSEARADDDLVAACRYSRRRRLGPYHSAASHEPRAQRERDLACLARAGFSFEVAQSVLDAPCPEALDEIIAGAQRDE